MIRAIILLKFIYKTKKRSRGNWAIRV